MDRLADLKTGLDDDIDVGDAPAAGDVEAGGSRAAVEGASEEENKELKKFYREMDALAQAINRINVNTDKLVLIYEDIAHDNPKREAEIKALVANTDAKAQAIRKRLKRLATENKAFLEQNPNSVAVGRIRVTTHQSTTKEFMAAVQNFEKVQEREQKNNQKLIVQDLQALNPDMKERDIEKAVESNEYGHLINAQQLSGAHATTKTRLMEIESRNRDVQELEKQIIELNQMFVDLSILVENQGELLNNIEYNVKATKDEARSAEVELVEARKNQLSARKKKILLLICVILIICAIVIPIVITQVTK
ncbi:Syntaxin-1A-like [Porphyridium purpureum]|uniref:Syntaxin-1A-like n=1 Tax=Porphyridium purpureum TaxID=35688 RepID=A0A5J4YUV0_PORPP|nr:Syntaxin-1A-like [Porphyridium purpureum]|eukprot:POR6146..scf209_3